jgi:hypothetical protein
VQAFIKAYSKSLHYDANNPNAHFPLDGDDEVGKIRAISVKVCLFMSHLSQLALISLRVGALFR